MMLSVSESTEVRPVDEDRVPAITCTVKEVSVILNYIEQPDKFSRAGVSFLYSGKKIVTGTLALG